MERLCSEKVGREGLRNPNAGFVPISEPLEQQAPLHYGMPPAQTGMTVGEQGRRRAVVEEEKEEKEGRGRVRGTRDSCERPEVVVQGVSGGDAAAGPACGNDVYEA